MLALSRRLLDAVSLGSIFMRELRATMALCLTRDRRTYGRQWQ